MFVYAVEVSKVYGSFGEVVLKYEVFDTPEAADAFKVAVARSLDPKGRFIFRVIPKRVLTGAA
jgi:hypothetical protein